MNKILLIIKREYLSRVKKKSFLLVTFLVPLFLIGIYALTIYLTAKSFENNQATVYVVDQSGLFEGKVANTEDVTFIGVSGDVAAEKERILAEGGKTFLLIIPADIEASSRVELFSKEAASFGVQGEVSDQLEEVLRDRAYADAGIDRATVESISPRVNISAKEITEEGEKDSSAGAAMGIAMSLSILVYICLFLYGSQVMRGIIEEKNSRIVEVIISSVKPFQLMMGKIIGIGLVGLTQFILWIVLSSALMGIAGTGMMGKIAMETQVENQQQLLTDSGVAATASTPEIGMVGKVTQELAKVDFQTIIITFLLYFFGGYLLYSALFAAVGSAVDSETETQQFMLPITIPLLFTYILSFGVLINDPHGPLAFWLSMVPFTSPIAMLVRVPFGVPVWEIALSLALLVGGFIVTTWVAGRIYRVGILMYGKKASYKELVKWFRYKG
ncbi:ABC transporter permease [Parapedobacter soli]|uniref:ABC transporter permease n=1 Tax=Parapedobacter soli TaxID=416955 RepID=UPI0021C65559|nr:ABC transporter permease [Parapedobacter soli]